MKTLSILFVISFFFSTVYAQSTTSKTSTEEFDILIEKEELNFEQSTSKSPKKDTVQIRVGKHNVEIISDSNNTTIDVEKLEDFESQWEDGAWDKENDKVETIKIKRKKKFDGHWSALEIGGNLLYNTDYSMYPEGTPAFLDTRAEKSFEVNWNFAEYSFGFGSYVGIVTGLGLNFNDYKFRNRYTLARDESGMIQPIALPENDFRKSKLSTVYLTAPLMLEIQIPGNHGADRMFIAGGLIGGLKLGDHTKTKIGNEKNKDRSDHNIAPVRWGYTARIGFDDVGIFATYYNTPLFEDGKGPVTTPVTLGFTFTF